LGAEPIRFWFAKRIRWRIKKMYEYRCKVVHIVDGDTVDVDIDLGFGVWLKKERIRMFGIDTPESRTRDLEEKKYGLAAKKFITEMLDDEGGIVLKTRKDAEGKFGRILGELWRTTNYADKSINDYMIDKRHAVAYHGQSKEDIQEQHIKNREFHNL
jgi:micrococcal nuclease